MGRCPFSPVASVKRWTVPTGHQRPCKLFVKSLRKNFTFFFLRHTRAAQKGGFPFAGRTSQAKAAAGASTRPYHSFSNLAKLANSFFVPTFSKAISSNVSLAIGVAESTIPWPKVLCFTVSPAR